MPARGKPAAASRRARLVLVALLALAAAPRLYLAVTDHGIAWPDEVYQSLEPAHRFAFGYGLQAWEYRAGARNLTFAATLAALMRTSSAVGLDSPRAYLLVVRVLLVALALWAIGCVYLLARRFEAPAWAALVATALASLFVPSIYFAHRALSEVASMPLSAMGLYLALEVDGARWRRLLGASLLGLACLWRPHNALLAVGLLACLVAWRSWRAALEAALVLALWALVLGLVDKLSWGGWFRSLVVYLDVNVAQDYAARRFGRQPLSYYLTTLVSAGGLGCASLLLSAAALVRWRRAAALLALALGFIAVHSAVGHKELRFVLPALPLLFAATALGLGVIAERARVAATLAACAAMLLALVSAARAPSLTYRDLGVTSAMPPAHSAFDWPGDVNRLLLAAHGRGDLCGLLNSATITVHSGGYTYLHRRVPLYARQKWPPSVRCYNYRIGLAPRAGEREVAREGLFVLLRRAGGCVRDTSYNDKAN
ncbi:MAG: hypothetical protein KC503_10620 [Myxococcales bacterium]|nr:hypothetical protein [Myxococcales bacterium]